jgi:hypothetical protein
MAVAQARLDVGAEGAGTQVGDERRRVHVADAGQATQVEGHAAEEGDRRAADAAAATALCDEARVPVTPAGGRSGVCGASVPLFGGVALDLCGLAGIWAVSVGRATKAGRDGTAPAAAQPMASGHQSLPASARSSSSEDTELQASPSRRAKSSSTATRAASSRSTMSPGAASIGVTGVGWLTTRPAPRRH